MGEDQDDATRTARMDVLIIELRALREAAGISYRELAARITAQREAAGMPSAAARIALSTVSDMFRLGRARINVNLLAEVARVLENDPTAADRWRERAITAMSTITDSATAVPVPGEPVPASFSDRVAADPFPVFAPLRPTLVRLAMLVLGGLLLNATGKFFNPLLGDVLFLDMIGTALVALLAGPWSAAAVGVIFVCVELLKSNLGGALFALTMISAGLIWGYGVRRGRWQGFSG